MVYQTIHASVQSFMDHINSLTQQDNPKWGEIFNKCFANTLLTTVKAKKTARPFY